jgi:hypothetical protein
MALPQPAKFLKFTVPWAVVPNRMPLTSVDGPSNGLPAV